MTENKRYSDGTLAKWYYSQTNVISDGDNEYYLRNKESVKDLNYNELLGTNDLLDELNKLSDENEKLKQDKTNFHRAMSRDRVKYNQFKDKVFCCIDTKIKLLKDCHMTNEAKILEDLKEEIGDVE